MVRLLTPLLVALGCGFDPSVQSGTVACGSAGECPSGFECCDGVCVTTGECGGTEDMGGIDASSDAGGDSGVDAGTDGGCVDNDDDGICGQADNCPTAYNPGQGDCDDDGMGDACDPVYEARCYGLRATLSSAGGIAQGSDGDLIGVAGEVSHSISSGPNHRLRGGLLPRAPRSE